MFDELQESVTGFCNYLPNVARNETLYTNLAAMLVLDQYELGTRVRNAWGTGMSCRPC